MVKTQFDKIRALAQEQFKKITRDIEKRRELDKIIEDQFFDDTHSDKLFPQFYEMPETNRSAWRHLDVRSRAIYVLCKSRAFTYGEIAGLFSEARPTTAKSVVRVFMRIKASV